MNLIIQNLNLIDFLKLSQTCKYDSLIFAYKLIIMFFVLTFRLFQKVCMESNIFYETDLQPYWNIVILMSKIRKCQIILIFFIITKIDENIIRSFSGFLKRATSINLSWTKSLSLNAIER